MQKHASVPLHGTTIISGTRLGYCDRGLCVLAYDNGLSYLLHMNESYIISSYVFHHLCVFCPPQTGDMALEMGAQGDPLAYRPDGKKL